MSIYADCKDSFRTLARIASKSIAEPPWFAIPVNAEEDGKSAGIQGRPPHQPNGLRATGKRVRARVSPDSLMA